MSKEKTYKKGDLRKALENKMQEYWGDSTIKVSAKEFARWFGIYCDMNGKSDDIRNAKELEKSEANQLSAWLGYPLY